MWLKLFLKNHLKFVPGPGESPTSYNFKVVKQHITVLSRTERLYHTVEVVLCLTFQHCGNIWWNIILVYHFIIWVNCPGKSQQYLIIFEMHQKLRRSRWRSWKPSSRFLSWKSSQVSFSLSYFQFSPLSHLNVLLLPFPSVWKTCCHSFTFFPLCRM